MCEDCQRIHLWLRLDVRSRVIDYLLSIAKDPSDARGPLTIASPPSQTAIALTIGSSRESVSRFVAQMEREGLITRRRRGLGTVGMDLDWKLIEERDRAVEAAA